MSKPPLIPSLAIIPNTAFGNIDEFITERNAVIAKGDALELARFFKKYNPKMDFPELKEEAIEIAMHKARIGLKSLTKEERQASHKWLHDHGYDSLTSFTEIEEDTDAQEAQVLPATGTGSNPDDPAGTEPEQPVVDVATVAGSSGETPTG